MTTELRIVPAPDDKTDGMDTIYIFGFAPSSQGEIEAGTGGMEWRRTYAEAAAELARNLFDGPGWDYIFRSLLVPRMTDNELSEWLANRPELWDPPATPTDHFDH